MRANRPLNVLITGASSGIGEATAERFRTDGNAVFLTGRRREPPTTMRADETYHSGDLTDEEFVAWLLREATESLGPLDTVVTCHGLQLDGNIVETGDVAATEVLDANLRSVLTVIKYAVPAMRTTASQIVLVGSRFGSVGMPGQVVYSAAKGGLNMPSGIFLHENIKNHTPYRYQTYSILFIYISDMSANIHPDPHIHGRA